MARDVQIPQPLLELALLAEKGSPTAASLATRFGLQEAEVARQIDALRRSDRQILRDFSPARVTAEIGARLRREGPERRASRWPGRLVAIGVVAAGAVAAIGVVPLVGLVRSRHAEQGLRAKGAARLLLFRQSRGGAAEQLRDGAAARAGDVLQLGYLPANAQYGALFSIDGAGNVTLHFPPSASETTALTSRKTLLPFSFRLDNAPAYERFVLVTSAEPLDVADLLRRARSCAQADPRSMLSLPPGAVADQIVLFKPSRKAR